MRVSVVSRHAPVADGTAPGRILLAYCTGLRDLGHDVTASYWGPEPPASALPDWCAWRPVPGEPWVRMKARALARPRTDVRRVPDLVADGDLALADDPLSYPGVAGHPLWAGTVHYATALDTRALRRRRPKDLQDWRVERAAVRRAPVTFTYSARVARAFGGRPVEVPVALLPVPALERVDRPTAVLMADWRWRPNTVALATLLRCWPTVRRSVPGAHLLLAGTGALPVASGDGVTVLGRVADAMTVLSQAAVLAFPCPDTSGPKVKVLEAMAAGVPVVTTAAGVEGLRLPSGAGWVAGLDGFGVQLAAALADPAERARRAALARAAVREHHSARAGAAARLATLGQPAAG